jgi:hypothetical protein
LYVQEGTVPRIAILLVKLKNCADFEGSRYELITIQDDGVTAVAAVAAVVTTAVKVFFEYAYEG